MPSGNGRCIEVEGVRFEAGCVQGGGNGATEAEAEVYGRGCSPFKASWIEGNSLVLWGGGGSLASSDNFRELGGDI